MGYDGLLLDHDGVLVTLGDESALTTAARNALRDVGVENPDPDAIDTISMWATTDGLREVSNQYGVDPERLWRARDDRAKDSLLAQTQNGGKTPYDDVDALESIEHPMGIVSNNQTRVVEFVLDHYDLGHHIQTIRARAPTPESLDRKKPRPTYLEEAMADLGVENPLYVGDSESDVEAGQRAGFDVAFLRRPHNRDVSLSTTPEYEVPGLDHVVDIL